MAAPYQPRVAPGGNAALPMAGADAFGAGVGRAVSGLGGAVEELALKQRALQQNEENAAAGKSLADLRLEATERAVDLRSQAGPGAAGHSADYGKWWDGRASQVLDGIGDEKVRRNAEVQLAAQRASSVGQEYEWEAGQRVAKVQTDEVDAAGVGLARIAAAPSLEAAQGIVAEERQAAADRIHGYAIPADGKADMLHKLDQGIADATMGLAVRTDPAKARALLDAGAFGVLGKDKIEQGYREVAVEERRAEAVAAHQAALAAQAAREQLATVEARQAAGEVLPDAELVAAEGLAKTLGDDSRAVTLHAMRIGNGVNRETQGWTALQFDTNIAALRAKGDKRTADEDIRLKKLETIAPERKAQFNNDPGQWAALNGLAAPAVDFADPSSWAARRQWQATVSKATGRPVPFLQPEEVTQLKSQFEDGPGGELAVMNSIAPLGGRTAQHAMRQIAPDDDMAARLVLLPPVERASARAGAAARKAHPDLVDGKQKPVTQRLFAERLGPAASLLDQGEVGAVAEIARSIYADKATKSGATSFDQAQWNAAVHRALGGTRDQHGNQLGGIGQWGGRPVLLPPDMTPQDFEGRLGRLSWGAKSDHAPVFSNGTAMSPAQVKSYLPIARPDGRYEFHGPGGTVLHGKDGGIWTVAITRQGITP